MTFQSVYGSYSQSKALLLHLSPSRRAISNPLESGGLVLYDLSSSYFEGKTCPLAALGHNHDGKKGKLQVNYGLLTDRRGR
jgi:transposase